MSLHFSLKTNRPSDWHALVNVAHAARFNVGPSSIATPMRAPILYGVYKASSRTLETLRKTKFALVVARCITDVYFCGFSKEELMSPLGQEAYVQVRPEFASSNQIADTIM